MVQRDSGSSGCDRFDRGYSGRQSQTHGESASPNIGFWDDPSASIHWLVKIPAAGKYRVIGDFASESANSTLGIAVAGQDIEFKAPNTGSYSVLKSVEAGEVHFKRPGVYHLTVSASPTNWRAVNVWQLKLTPAN